MIRAAAKNHADVVVIVDVEDYPRLLEELQAHDGSTRLSFRREMAQKAYARTAAYDAAISNWLARETRRERAEVARVRRQARERAALWREPASERRVLCRAGVRAPASRRRARFRARNSPTTTSTTPTPPTSWSPNSIRRPRPPWRSSSTPIPAASRRARACWRPMRRALACDPVSAFGGVIAVNRAPRRGRGAQDRRDLHRGDHRAGGGRRGAGDRRGQEEPAPADRRRAARPARADA